MEERALSMVSIVGDSKQDMLVVLFLKESFHEFTTIQQSS